MKHIKYPKTQQFRNIVSDISKKITFTGLDEEGKPMFDPSVAKPTITFKGTVKLHGTNASVCCNSRDGIYVQSRNNAFGLDSEEVHMGFTAFVRDYKQGFKEVFDDLFLSYNISPEKFTITLYGEWAGKGIQKGIAISNIAPSFYLFAIRVSEIDNEEENNYWIDAELSTPFIRNVNNYEAYSIDVDFNMPKKVQQKLVDITNEVEKECPIASALGHKGLGEGVVWTGEYKGEVYRFKVKGEKHSVTKVKKLASVDVEKLESIEKFVEYSVTQSRFDQAITEVFESVENIDVQKMGDFLRWIIKDIMSEEMDTMTENGLEPKDVNKYISFKAKEMFFKVYNA